MEADIKNGSCQRTMVRFIQQTYGGNNINNKDGKQNFK